MDLIDLKNIKKEGLLLTNDNEEFMEDQDDEDLSEPPKFQLEWLQKPEFEDWLMEGVRPELAFCAYCDISVCAYLCRIHDHAQSERHIFNSDFSGSLQIDEMNKSFPSTNVHGQNHDISSLLILDMRSDSLTVPSRNMRLMISQPWSGDTSYGTDDAVLEFENSVSEMLGKEEGLLFPSHTMANLVAVLSHCQSRGSFLFTGEESDIYKNNREALIKFGGVNVESLPECCNGTFDLDYLETKLKNASLDAPLTALVSYECPHARKGGCVAPLKWINEISALRESTSCSFRIHCDGTRLSGAAVSANLPASHFVSGCDSVTYAVDKGVGAPLGAVLAGDKDFIQRAKFIRRFLGGHIHQAGMFAAAGMLGIKNSPSKLKSLHEKASLIAKAINLECSNVVRSDPDVVHTNVVLLRCPSKRLDAHQLKQRLEMVANEQEFPQMVLLSEVVNETTVSLMVHGDVSFDHAVAVIEKVRVVIKENS